MAQHCRKLIYRFRDRRKVQTSWQAQRFRKVRQIAGDAALAQGKVQVLWQTGCFRKMRGRFCGRRGTFAMLGAYFVASAALVQASRRQATNT